MFLLLDPSTRWRAGRAPGGDPGKTDDGGTRPVPRPDETLPLVVRHTLLVPVSGRCNIDELEGKDCYRRNTGIVGPSQDGGPGNVSEKSDGQYAGRPQTRE